MPVAIAARGMPECSASSGSCAMVSPPRSLIRLIPIAPSPSAPESTIATDRGPCVSASVRKKISTATRFPFGCAALGQPQVPIGRGEMLARRDDIDVVRLHRAPSVAATTGIVVERWNISASVLSCSGERCRMTTKAMPESAGIDLKNSCIAAMPPAEPPSPTSGSIP